PRLGQPALSPDGERIVVPIYESDPGSRRSHLVRIDRDGRETRLTSGDENVALPSWSPDGRSVAYRWAGTAAGKDSGFIYLVDPNRPGSARRLTAGLAPRWLDSRSLLVNRPTRTYLVRASDGQAVPQLDDSTFV